MSSAAQAGRPKHVPAGFKFRAELRGATGFGFPGDASQLTFVYARTALDEDRLFPLTLSVSTATSARLVGTEQHRGTRIRLPHARSYATYHDGLWMLGSGADERVVGDSTTIHWDRSDVHSLTVRRGGRVYAVRGARSRGVGLEDLVRILESAL
jgi:hypothetical protein